MFATTTSSLSSSFASSCGLSFVLPSRQTSPSRSRGFSAPRRECGVQISREKRAAKLSGGGDGTSPSSPSVETKKKNQPPMSKQQKQKLRKQRSEKLRAIVSSEGRRYEKIHKDFQLTRDTAREYVLSVRQKSDEASSSEERAYRFSPIGFQWRKF